MPLVVAPVAVLLLVVLPQMPRNVLAFGVLAFAALIIALRVHFASWYARDKGCDESWGLLGALGLVGWLFLWSLNDRGFRFSL